MSSAPIADLSYRGYDGPLADPRLRWWTIARTTFQSALKKKSYWVLTTFAGGYYLVFMAILFFIEQLALSSPQGNRQFEDFLKRIVWKDQFVHGISTGQIWFLMITLLVGAGAIANDNRANALLVYLSKPCTKLDYLFGKWFGVFLAVLLSMSLPTAFFFLYGSLSYTGYGFLRDDPWMGPKLLAFLPLSAAVHASVVLGISSLFKQGRAAGATYAGLYFLTNFFTQIISIRYAMLQSPRRGGSAEEFANSPMRSTLESLFYGSVDGTHIGAVKAILGTNGTPYFGIPSPLQSPPAPNLMVILGIWGAVVALMLILAWGRVKVVEVVG